MDRGVFIGGGLICASFLLAVLLNESARQPVTAPPRMANPAQRAEPKCAAPERQALASNPIPGSSKPVGQEAVADSADCK